ncbi:centrosomal protein of 290 kDa isoform X4 [Ascaphus truei]|uniref:centrosomal protein of 290 kDa isoform X4 n=1 Tax=Ascaphus truei TaxID=8439 RepID=UPI003F5A25A5
MRTRAVLLPFSSYVWFWLLQGLQDRDNHIKMLTEQLEQHTKEMETHSLRIEDLRQQLQKDKGISSDAQHSRTEELQAMLHLLEQRLKEAERVAELAENDAREKDKDLIEALRRMRDYETGIYGLEEAVTEIQELKTHVKIRDREIEALTMDINKLELKMNDILDENEDLRERLGLDPKTMIDLREFKNIKTLKQQQYRAENQILLKEIERLEEERVELKQQVRKLAQEKGKRAASLGLTADDLHLNDNSPADLKSRKRTSDFLENTDEIRGKNDHLSKQLNDQERELERNRTIVAELKSKLKELSEENKQLQKGMGEILQAIKETQKDSTLTGGETALMIPSLERLVNAIESKNKEGMFDISVHLKAQADQLTGRNEELRQELKGSRKEATNVSNQLAKAIEKISYLENELAIQRQSEGANVVFRAIDLPEGMSLSSTNLINSLNEYTLHLLQEIESKEQLVINMEDALEDYKRKFAVIRHQQGLFYKEYQSERETWQVESEKLKEEKTKLECQKEHDEVQIKEYMNLLDAFKMTPDEIKKLLAESSRKMTVLRVNEKSLTRRYTTLLEMEQHLRKENVKLKNELTEMETAVGERIGYLQRYKEMAAFKIAAIQKALDGSVAMSELEMANKQYNELTAKYRDMLQKDNLLVQRTANLEHLEYESTSLKTQIHSLNKELEITKEKLHTLEQAWEHLNKLGGDSVMDKATKAISNNEIVSISKKITMLEMKELNERQRAEHSQKMYEHLRTTIKQIEERNFELETKFAELTKINIEAQKVEQALRDDLANSVSKAVSDADRRRIVELEKSEAELKIEASKLRDLSDIAKMQVSTLAARQLSREKEVDSLRKQVLDYQDQTDEKALIAKLHQQIVALQVSESTAVGKLEATSTKLHKMEAYNLRLEQKLDVKEQALYYARLEGRNRAKHLRQTIQSLRRQFSGALPLAQQEKFSKTMMQLQNDKLKTINEMELVQQERRSTETRALELELKLKGVEELICTLKDARGAQKVTEWHKKMEELRLQDLKLSRELSKKMEELKFLNNIISEHEHTIGTQEEEIVQQANFHEDRQMAWDQREVELERQLDMYEHQQNEVLSTARKFEEATGSVPDPSLPLPQQLEIALRKIRVHVQTILETKAACKTLEEKLKKKEALLWTAEQNVLSRDKVINELRLRLPATAEREKLLSDLSRREDDSEQRQALKVAHQTIGNMQARLNQKEEVLKKYQHLLAKAREEQEETAKKHADDLNVLYQKLDLYSDTSLNKFKEAALELVKKPSLQVPSSAHLMRLAEMEQTVAEQDNSLASLSIKLKNVTSELERQKHITMAKVNEFEISRARLEENHALEIKKLKSEAEESRSHLSEMQKEIQYLNTELQAQKEANTRAPTATMKNLVERLKNQLTLKEKQQKALSKALLALRAEMTAHAEQQIIDFAEQKEENLNIQQIVDRQTKGLKAQIEDLNEQQIKLKETLKSSKNKENALIEESESLSQELRGKQKALNKLQRDKDEVEKDNEELKKRIKRLTNSMQSKQDLDSKQSTIEELQKKMKRLEMEVDRKTEEVEREPARDKSCKEEIIRWEEGKKWQSKLEGMRNRLRDKDKEVDSLTKQLTTLKELYSKADQEKIILQKKLRSRGVTVDHVLGVRTTESEKEVEELRKKNHELENDISYMRIKQALPRDSVVEDLHLKNQYLKEKLQALEQQLSRPSSVAGDTDALTVPSFTIETGKHKHVVFPNKKRNLLRRTKESKTILIEPNSKNVDECFQTSSDRLLPVSRAETPGIQKASMVVISKTCEASFSPGRETTSAAADASVALGCKSPSGIDYELFIFNKEGTPFPDNCSAAENIDATPLSSNAAVAANTETTSKSVSSCGEATPPGDVSLPVSRTATRELGEASHSASTQTTAEQESDDGSSDENTLDTISNGRKNGADNIEDEEEFHSHNRGLQSGNGEIRKQEMTVFNTLNCRKLKPNSHVPCTTSATLDREPYNGPNNNSGDKKSSIFTPTEEDEFQKDYSSKIEVGSEHNQVLQTSGLGSDDQSIRDLDLQRENLRLSSENVELHFQLEQANKDLPRLTDQICNLKEMCELLKADKFEAERKLGNVRGSGRSGKTIPELEKTIALMKRVIERVQRENDELKKAPGIVSNEKLSNLELENERLKSEKEKLQLHAGGQLSMRYEAKTKGLEKVIAENERLRKELKKETEISEKLRIVKRNVEMINEKMTNDLEETRSRLNFAESRGPQLEGADGKAWKSVVVSRMYETKMKEMEVELKKKNDSIADLKQLLKGVTERELKTEKTIQHLKDEIELLKHFPEDAKTEEGLTRDFQILRLANSRLENEKAELVHQMEVYRQQIGVSTHAISTSGYDELLEKGRKHDKLIEEVIDLQTHIKTSDLEKLHFKEEIKRLKKELDNFDPTFFEEIEDLKYNYNEEVKKNILLEEKLKALSDQFGVHVDIPANVSVG